jgi:hypothetical protein
MSLARVDKGRQKELMRSLFDSKSAGMARKVISFIEDHWDSEDKDLRKDAHKLLHKYFDVYMPKTQLVETKTEVKILDERINQAITHISANEHRRIEVQEAEIISPEEALSARNAK